MGTINMGATDASLSVLTGKDLAQGILPDDAIAKFQKPYVGRKRNAGSVVVLIAKGEDKSVVSVCFYTAPWQIDKQIATALNKVPKNKGLDGDMKLRHPGLEWIGIDKSALTSHCDYVQKMGWVATPGSCHGVVPARRHGEGPLGRAAHLAPAMRLLPRRAHCARHDKTKYQVILDVAHAPH